MRLYVNIDHVATVREARRTDEPDPVEAAFLAELGGADGVTVHLREDRRHIQDRDVQLLMESSRSGVNLEAAANSQMIRIACEFRPMQVTLVPENREEITTEGGLNLADAKVRRSVARAVKTLRDAGIRTALFIDPIRDVLVRASTLGVEAVELHTGEYANAQGDAPKSFELGRLHGAARFGVELGLAVHAGHGLTYRNVIPVAALPEIEELNIGHSIVSRAVLVGMERAVSEMLSVVLTAPDRVPEPGHWVPPRGY
jgi:pyridoxine 5-phosphate synthase